MKALDIIGRDLNEKSAEDVRAFYLRVGRLWLRGKESNGTQGIVPVKLYPKEGLKYELRFRFSDGTSTKEISCWDIHYFNNTAGEAHICFYLLFYGNKIEGGIQDGLCKAIKPGHGAHAASVEKTKTFSNESKTPKLTGPTSPPRKTATPKKPLEYDPLDPFSGILY